MSSNLLSILINLSQSEQARLCPKAVIRIRGSKHAFRKQICVSINLPEVSFFPLIKCLPTPWTIFQYNLGVTYHYPHMLPKTATQNCSLHFISFLAGFSLQLLFLAVFFPVWLKQWLRKGEKKAVSCFLKFLIMCSSPTGCCNSACLFEVFQFKKTKQKFSERHTLRWKKKIRN